MDKTVAKVLQLAEQYRDYTAKNLSRLVKIKSLTGREGEVAAELKNNAGILGAAAQGMEGLAAAQGMQRAAEH